MSVTTPQPEEGSIDLSRYGVLVRRSWLDVVTGAVVGAVLALALLVLSAPSYTATATVDLNAITSDPFGSARSESDLLDPATEVVLARSSTVVSRSVENPDDPQERAALRAGLEVTAVPDSTLVEISSTAANPSRARRQADTVARAYLTYRGEQSRTRRASILTETEQTIDSLQDSLQAAQQVADAADAGSAEAARALAQITSYQSSIASLSATRDTLTSLDVSGGTVINAASDQAATRSPTPRTLLLGGLLGGTLVGLAWGVTKRALRRRVRDDLDLERARGFDLVATLDTPRGVFPPSRADLEVLRALGARLARLDHAGPDRPGGRLTLVLDDTVSRDLGDLPAALAVVLRQEWGACHVVVPGCSAEQEQAARKALGLRETRDGRAASALVDKVTVSFHSTDSSITATDSVMTRAVLEELGAALARGERLLLHVPATAGLAPLLAASSVADSAVVLVEARHSRTASLTSWARELAGLHTATVLLPAGRVGPGGRAVTAPARRAGLRTWAGAARSRLRSVRTTTS